MQLALSNRLLACAQFVRPGDCVADIGCDHGYLGIYLLRNHIAARIIASDINQLPLESAVRNAKKYGVDDRMSFYLSDGVRNIPRDFQTLICAGMGADTMISILNSAPWLNNTSYRLILQCQSKRHVLRRYLAEQGYAILHETLAQDGKFIYPIMEVSYQPPVTLSPAGCYISPALLRSGSPLLPEFYRRIMDGMHTTVRGLEHSEDKLRLEEYRMIAEELAKMEDLINAYCS